LPAGFLEHSTLEARKFAGKGAQIQEAEGRRTPDGGYIVCGSVAVNGEVLPFSTLWDADEAPEDGATLVGADKRARDTSRHSTAYHELISLTCERARLQDLLPQGTSAQ
jgi:hypothetical protein